jgi:UPF0716 family protein affecting phage T7 exclusion
VHIVVAGVIFPVAVLTLIMLGIFTGMGVVIMIPLRRTQRRLCFGQRRWRSGTKTDTDHAERGGDDEE